MLAKLIHHPRHGGARVRRAALRGCEIVSGNLLQARDRVAEGTDILFGQSRQCLDENEPADFAGQTGLEIREPGEGSLFLAAMHAFGARVEDDNHPPLRREIHARDDRRRRGPRPVSAIDNETSLLEQAQADTGTRPAPQQKRVACMIWGQAFQTPQRGGDSKGQLGPRAQARIGRNRFVHGQAIGGGQIEGAGEKGEILSSAFDLHSFGRGH